MKMPTLSLFLAAAVLIGCHPAQSSVADAAANRDDASLQNEMLKSHNDARRAAGSPPLLWDNKLAESARAYADKMARSGRFEHDSQQGTGAPQGENLWMGSRGAYNYREMAGAWIDERRIFKNGVFPDNSTSGDWTEVGHYTQIIWPKTTHVGCAIGANAGDEFLVCRYFPAGNIIGSVLTTER